MSAQPKPAPAFDPAAILNDTGRPLHHTPLDEATMRILAHWRKAAAEAGAADVGQYIEWLEIRHAAALEIIEATGALAAAPRRKNAPGLTRKLEAAILDELRQHPPAVARVAMVNVLIALNPRPRRGVRMEAPAAAPGREPVGETPEGAGVGETPEAAGDSESADPEDEDRAHLLRPASEYEKRILRPESFGHYRTRGGAVAVVVSKIQNGKQEPFLVGYMESDPRRRAQHWHPSGAHFRFGSDDLVAGPLGEGLTMAEASWDGPQTAPQLPPASRQLKLRKEVTEIDGCFTRRRP